MLYYADLTRISLVPFIHIQKRYMIHRWQTMSRVFQIFHCYCCFLICFVVVILDTGHTAIDTPVTWTLFRCTDTITCCLQSDKREENRETIYMCSKDTRVGSEVKNITFFLR